MGKRKMTVLKRKAKTFQKLLKHDKHQILVAIFNNIIHTGITDLIPDKAYLKLAYRIHFGKKLDLENPVDFNEKLQWLKLHSDDPKYVTMVDKVLVKDYVSKIIGNEYIIPTIGVYNTFDEIDFSTVPERFVIKCNHDSGSVIICNDKNECDFQAMKKKIMKCLRKSSFYWGREKPYKYVDRKILIEENIQKDPSEEINDYKLMCFSGKVKCSFVCTDRFSKDGLKVTFFDNEWNVMPFERHYPKSRVTIPKPRHYDEMVRLAEMLSKDLPFVRVDFYEVNDRVYFGELTLFPGCGWEEFTPAEWDTKLGEWIDLSSVK